MKITLTQNEVSAVLIQHFANLGISNPEDLVIEIVESLPSIKETEELIVTSEESKVVQYIFKNNRKLYNFLIDRDMMLKYIRNYLHESTTSTTGISDGSLTIDSAFSWSDSPEGYVFWETLEEEYSIL